MSDPHDPMCSVPLSYLTMLQERREESQKHTITWNPSETMLKTPQAIRQELENQAPSPAAQLQWLADTVEEVEAKARVDLTAALERIAAFEERAGCKLEQIPVEALGEAQNAYVNQQAIDTLKRENESLCKEVNRLSSALGDAEKGKVAPMVRDAKTGKMRPRKKPGRKAAG